MHRRGIRSPELIEHMRIGYAPGGCLRGWLTQLGYPLPALRQAGLVTTVGYDAYRHRIVFPLEGNLYGRSVSDSAQPHRFLPGAKGGLYSWAQARSYPEVILVEGLFDYAVLWEAGFRNVTCSLGTRSRLQCANCAIVLEPFTLCLLPTAMAVQQAHSPSHEAFRNVI